MAVLVVVAIITVINIVVLLVLIVALPVSVVFIYICRLSGTAYSVVMSFLLIDSYLILI